MLAIALLIYAAAMVAANLTVAAFGPIVTPINAFLLIGLDLALRDLLQMRLKVWQMALLIVGTGVVSLLLNPAADKIALASSLSFLAAAVVDWGFFVRLKGSWLRRSMGSNVAGAAVDSFVFPLLAFGAFLPQVVVMQFVAKVAGGAVWSWLLARRFGKQLAATEARASA